MNKRVSSIVITILLPLVAAAQQGQTLRDRDPDLSAAKRLAAEQQAANFHRGPFYLLSRIRIADAGFTETGMPTGDQSGISLSIEAPHRLYFVPRKKTVYTLEFVPGYSFFDESRGGNQFNYLLRGDAHFLLNHLYLDVYALRADQLRAHVADINRMATTREEETGVAGEVKYSSRTSVLFTVRLRDTEYPRDRFQPDPIPDTHVPVEALNRQETNARVSFQHKTFPRTSLFFAAEGSDYDFDNVARYASRRTYFGGGFLYDVGRVNVRVEAGPVKLDFDDPAVADYSGLSAQVRAGRTAGRWTTSAGAQRDLGFSIFANNPYFVSTAGNVGVDYVATRRLTLHGRVAAERDEFEQPVLGQLRTDDIFYSSVGFTYGIRRVRFGADIGWYERDSTAFGDTDSGIRYVLRLSLTP